MKAGAYYLGTGDYSDFLSPSNRKALKVSGLYDTATDLIESWHDEWLGRLQEVLKPTAGRWLTMVEGHHYYAYSDGTTTDTRLANCLGAPFGGTSSVVRLTFQDSNRHSAAYNIFVTHGEGRGFGHLRRLAPGFPGVDMFVQGHNCELSDEVLSCIEFYGRPGQLKMRERDQRLVLAGGFMRGYAAGSRLGRSGRASGSYVEQRGLRPLAIGGRQYRLTPTFRDGCGVVEVEAA